MGGQLNLARQVPGKEEFHGLVDWFAQLGRAGGDHAAAGAAASVDDLRGFDEVVIATGVAPRDPGIAGQERALSYIDVLRGAPVGPRVAVIGAGGIGFDVAEFLVQAGHSATNDPALWRREWGVGDPARRRAVWPSLRPTPRARQVWLLQRKAGKTGAGPWAKPPGWIHRAALQMKGVKMLGGVSYRAITTDGLLIVARRRVEELLAVDTVVLCAGQVPERGLADALTAAGIAHHVIGGADVAAELDAKRAIDQARGWRRFDVACSEPLFNAAAFTGYLI